MTYVGHDELLHWLAGTGPELRNHAPNHAPMVIEALAALGREGAANGWFHSYERKLVRLPRSSCAIGNEWREALGDFERLGQWHHLFRIRLEQTAWPEVIEEWLPRLIPGSMAAGTHGIIRCGHAVRALNDDVTDARLHEMASALAYCAARYRTVGAPPVLTGSLDLDAATRRLPLLDPTIDRRRPPPQIVVQLNGLAAFTEAVNALAAPDDAMAALLDLAAIGARLYLGNAGRHPLVLLHAVTGPAALYLLLERASPQLRSVAFAFMWQAVAAWAAAFGNGLAEMSTADRCPSWDEIIDRAVACGDEHAIKLTEAARRMDCLRPSEAFCAAAKDWLDRLERAREWSQADKVAAGIRTRLPGSTATEPNQSKATLPL